MLDAQQLLWTQIAAGVCLLIFAGLSWSVLRFRSRMLAARNWTVTEGVVVASTIDQPPAHASDDLHDATPMVRYRYRVAGRDFEGDRIEVGGTAMTTRALAIRAIAQYPVGLRVDVHVDPADPANALLEPAQPGNIIAVAVMAIAFGAATVVLAAHAIAGKVLYAGNGVPLFAYALPAAAIAVATFGLVSFLQTRQKASASSRWPTIPGTILQSSLIEERIEERGNDDKSLPRLMSRYQHDLRYRYRIGTRDYVGVNTNWGWTAVYGSREPAEAAAGRYRPGQTVTVHYDPAQPANAVLEPAGAGGSAAPLVLALIFGLAGIGMLLFFVKVGFA